MTFVYVENNLSTEPEYGTTTESSLNSRDSDATGDSLSSDASDKDETNHSGYETHDETLQTSLCRAKTNFKFTLSSDEYGRIAPQQHYRRLRVPWTEIFYREFNKQNKQCALVFTYNQCQRSKSRKHGHFWSGRAICKVDRQQCIKVSFAIVNEPQPGEDVEVIVTVVGSCTHGTAEDAAKLQPEQPNRRFLKGQERVEVAQILQQTVETPASLFEKRLTEMDPVELSAGNTTHCQRQETFRQALYERKRKERLHDNMAVELDLMRETLQASLPGSKGIDGFIQGVGLYPFYTIMYTEAQVAAYIELCKADDSFMHLDSTGSVIRDFAGQKRAYYYCLYNAAKKMPACEFVTTRHNATWLSSLLEMFGEDAKLLNGRRAVRPRHVVTDFSFALIYGVLYAYNKQTIVDYLSFTYRVIIS